MKTRFATVLLMATIAIVAIVPVAQAASGGPGGFDSAPEIIVDGDEYTTAIPGHYWRQTGPNRVVAKHYNTGPGGAAQWWSSTAPDGELLYVVHGIIDTWSPEKAERYTKRGYGHYHELLLVDDETLHPTKVMWLKHTAVASFNLDRGPAPQFGHEVTPGVDTDFIPNWMMPYSHSPTG